VIYLKSHSELVALSEIKLSPNQHSVDKIKQILNEKKNLDAAVVLQVPSVSHPCQPAKTGGKNILLLNFTMHLGTVKHGGLANAIRYNIQHNGKFIPSVCRY